MTKRTNGGGAHAPGSLEGLRQRNRDVIIGSLRHAGAASRADLARQTGLSRSTVSTVVADLLKEGLVRETPSATGGPAGSGRPGTPLSLNPAVGAVLAIDLAPSAITCALYDMSQAHLGTESRTIDAPAETLDRLIGETMALIETLLASCGRDRGAIAGAAMAVPAPIEQASRAVGQQSVIPAIVGTTLEREMSRRLGVPFTLENDANLSALAECSVGAAAGHRDAVYIEISEGIGAGLVVDGRLLRGARGTAGEIGHTPIAPDGPVCRCGNRGCLEMLAAVGAITALVADQFDHPPGIEEIIRRADEGNTLCRRVIRDAASRIGGVIGMMCNLLNPTAIVIGGELAAAWSILEPPIREALDRSAIHAAIQDLHIGPGTLGPEGRLIGARTLVMQDGERFPIASLG